MKKINLKEHFQDINYSNDVRNNIKTEFPEKTPREVIKIIAERWNNLKENKKEEYQKYLDESEELKNINK